MWAGASAGKQFPIAATDLKENSSPGSQGLVHSQAHFLDRIFIRGLICKMQYIVVVVVAVAVVVAVVVVAFGFIALLIVFILVQCPPKVVGTPRLYS